MPVVVVLAHRPSEQKGGEIVMVKRSIEPFIGQWCLPGGYVNAYEDPRMAAIREFSEETGLGINLQCLIHACNPDPAVQNKVVLYYLGEVQGEGMKTSAETSEIGFFNKGNCPKACFSTHQEMITSWWSGRIRQQFEWNMYDPN